MLNQRFTFLCNKEERQLIKVLSRYFRRSQGDAIRLLIRIASDELSCNPDRYQSFKKNEQSETQEHEFLDQGLSDKRNGGSLD